MVKINLQKFNIYWRERNTQCASRMPLVAAFPIVQSVATFLLPCAVCIDTPSDIQAMEAIVKLELHLKKVYANPLYNQCEHWFTKF
jgi:hypothetical protein